METITPSEARRLALARAGLLKAQWTGLPKRATGSTQRARKAAHRIIRRFGYLQLDTVSIAGARSHAIVLLSRLAGFDHELAETLLQPDVMNRARQTEPERLCDRRHGRGRAHGHAVAI